MWRESDSERTGENVTNWRPRLVSPGLYVRVGRVFCRVERRRRVGLKENRFLMECGILSEIRPNGVSSMQI